MKVWVIMWSVARCHCLVFSTKEKADNYRMNSYNSMLEKPREIEIGKGEEE